VLRQVRRLASSGLPLYPFILTLFDLIGEAIPAGDLPRALWADARGSSSWVFANLEVAKWVPVLVNCGALGNPEAWPGLRPRRELDCARPVLTLGEFTAPDYRRSLLYNEFFRRLKLEQGLLVQLISHNELVGYYPMYRSSAMPPFGRDEIAFLTEATPHIAHGLKTARMIDAQTLAITASAPFASQPGVIVMDSTGRPVALDQRARSLFFQAGLCDGVAVQACSEAQWRPLLEHIARLLRAIFEQGMSSQGDIGAPTAQIVCYRAGIILRLRGYATAGASRRNIFVVLVEQIEPEEFFRQRIMYRYGLAPREAEVMAFLRNNVPTGRIAAELGVSPVTVKTYIRQIISKLEVDNLSALRAVVGHQSPF
jgi:DNA-binding CsgD family transcriptional regulator